MTLSLLVVFFFLAGRLFRSSVLLSARSQQFADNANRIDSAMFQLRRDVWSSGKINVADPHSAQLRLSDGTQISWQINSDGDVTRTIAGEAAERWSGLGPNWSLSGDGLSLSVTDVASPVPQPMRLLSQSLLAQKEQP